VSERLMGAGEKGGLIGAGEKRGLIVLEKEDKDFVSRVSFVRLAETAAPARANGRKRICN
jgi:hypothetical protein